MAIDEADRSDATEFSEGEASDAASETDRPPEGDAESDPPACVGEYTWAEFMEEYGYGDEVSDLYPDSGPEAGDQLGLETGEAVDPPAPSGDDWERVAFDPAAYLGHHPDDLEGHALPIAGDNHDELESTFLEYVDPETTPVVKDVWTWEHYKWEYYYEDDGSRPRDASGEIVRHDEEAALGFDPDDLEDRLATAGSVARELEDVVDERTVDVQEDIDEDEFFSTVDGATTLANRYDLEKAVPLEKKRHFREVERYWVNKPYAYVVIFHSEKENEKKYYVIEPYLNEIEVELQDFLSGKLRTTIKYADEGVKETTGRDDRRTVIEDETRRLLSRYDLFDRTASAVGTSLVERIKRLFEDDDAETETDDVSGELEGISVRPEPVILEEDPDTLNEYQVEKLLYQLKRNFIGYERIDGIKHDINVEDISCDGYNSPVFVYHSEYEQIISNIYHGEDELDDFVVKLAQRSGKGISKRLPQVDATLPDGSRAQLTLGKEVSDHGTNYTIRQFKDVPFTPIDLINWNTFSLDEMAFLWLCIENHKSLIFAGGTASGKTTSLNAVSLFIPSSAKIVSIEDTREVELPQRNWIASVTRPSFSDDEQGDVDEFDLLEAALRQRPDYIVMGEIRGEEGRTLFQVMSTGHTTYTTFHADSVDEVLKRFTTDPINVSKTMFTALDLVSIQTQTRVQGRKVRRNKALTEINHYEAEHDEINVQDVYQWQAETDEFLKMGDSNTLEEIQFDRGWSREKLETELFKRKVILAYLIENGLNTYAEVAATVQAFINDPDTILTLIANGQLEDSLADLREMESVLIDVDPEKEALVPRPEATPEIRGVATDTLERAEESLFDQYRGTVPGGLASALADVDAKEEVIEVDAGTEDSADAEQFEPDTEPDDALETDEWVSQGRTTADTATADSPAWVTDDTELDVGSNESTADDATQTAVADSTDDSVTRAESNDERSLVPASESGSTAGDETETQSATEQDRSTDESDVATAGSTGEDLSSGPSSNDPVETRFDESATVGDAEPGSDAGRGERAGGTVDDRTGFPSDEPNDEDFAGLFDDIEETLDEMNEVAGTEPDRPHTDETVTDNDDRPVFSVSEYGFEPATESDEPDRPRESSVDTDASPPETPDQAADGDEQVAGATDESPVTGRKPPTIEVGGDDAERDSSPAERTDATSGGDRFEGTPFDSSVDGSVDGHPEDSSTVTGDSTGDESRSTGDSSGDGSASKEADERDSRTDGVEREPPTIDVSEHESQANAGNGVAADSDDVADTDDTESIFGTDPEDGPSVFGEADTDTGDDGSLFDGSASEPGDASIFGREDADDGDGSEPPTDDTGTETTDEDTDV